MLLQMETVGNAILDTYKENQFARFKFEKAHVGGVHIHLLDLASKSASNESRRSTKRDVPQETGDAPQIVSMEPLDYRPFFLTR